MRFADATDLSRGRAGRLLRSGAQKTVALDYATVVILTLARLIVSAADV